MRRPSWRRARVRAADEDDRGRVELFVMLLAVAAVHRRELRSRPRRRCGTGSRTTRGWSSARGRSTSGSRRSSGSACRSSASRSTGTRSRVRRPADPASPRDPAYDWRRPGQDPARPAPPRPDARAHAGRDAGVGERRPGAELRPAAAARLPRLRARRRHALPLGSVLADLERAEPAPLAQTDEGGDLRPAPAQPGVRGDPRRSAARPGRRRRRRRRAAGWGASRPSPGSAAWPPPTRSSTPTRTTRTPRRRAETPSSGGCRNCPSITMATLPKLLILVRRSFGPKPVWLTEYGYQTNPAGHVPGRLAEEAGDAAQPRGDARLAAGAGHDADPVPLPRRGPCSAASRPGSSSRTTGRSPRCRDSSCRSRRCGETGSRRSSGVRSATAGPGGSRTGWRRSTGTCGSRSGTPG